MSRALWCRLFISFRPAKYMGRASHAKRLPSPLSASSHDIFAHGGLNTTRKKMNLLRLTMIEDIDRLSMPK